MLFTEKYDLPDGGIHEGRAERAGKAAPLGLYEIDVRLAVDLRPAEEEDVDPALPREVEQLARALGERVALTLLQQGNSQGRIFLLQKRQRSEEHTSELQSRQYLVCRLLLEKKKNHSTYNHKLLHLPT